MKNKEKCMVCGSALVVDDYAEVDEKEFREDDTEVKVLACPHCGTRYHVFPCPSYEKEDYPYWNM